MDSQEPQVQGGFGTNEIFDEFFRGSSAGRVLWEVEQGAKREAGILCFDISLRGAENSGREVLGE